MKHIALIMFVCYLLGASVSMAHADEKPAVETGTLILEDDVNRDESTPDKENIGNGWTSNSAWRAKGRKQVDLAEGAMMMC